MKAFIVLSVVLALATVSQARVFGKCEFVQIARQNFPAHEVADWSCIAKHESDYNSQAINPNNVDGSVDYGIFQINNRYWCYPGTGCGVSCDAIKSDDISQSIRCAKIVKAAQGFSAWVAWNNHCVGRDLSDYVSGC